MYRAWKTSKPHKHNIADDEFSAIIADIFGEISAKLIFTLMATLKDYDSERFPPFDGIFA